MIMMNKMSIKFVSKLVSKLKKKTFYFETLTTWTLSIAEDVIEIISVDRNVRDYRKFIR